MDPVEISFDRQRIVPRGVGSGRAGGVVGVVIAPENARVGVAEPGDDPCDAQHRREGCVLHGKVLRGFPQGHFHSFLFRNPLGRADQVYGLSLGVVFRHAALNLHPLPFPVVEPVHEVGFVEFLADAFDQLVDHPDGLLPEVGMNAGEVLVHGDDITALLVRTGRMGGVVGLVIAVERPFFQVALPRNHARKAEYRRKGHILARQFVLGSQQRSAGRLQLGDVLGGAQDEPFVAETERCACYDELMLLPVERAGFDPLEFVEASDGEHTVDPPDLFCIFGRHETLLRAVGPRFGGKSDHVRLFAPENAAPGLHAFDLSLIHI